MPGGKSSSLSVAVAEAAAADIALDEPAGVEIEAAEALRR